MTASQSDTIDQVMGGTGLQNQFYSSRNPADSYGITASQPLFRRGQPVAGTTRAKASVQSERAKLESTEQNVFVSIVTDYCDAVRDKAILGLLVRDEQILLEKARSVRTQFLGGEPSRTEVAQTEAAIDGPRLGVVWPKLTLPNHICTSSEMSVPKPKPHPFLS